MAKPAIIRRGIAHPIEGAVNLPTFVPAIKLGDGNFGGGTGDLTISRVRMDIRVAILRDVTSGLNQHQGMVYGVIETEGNPPTIPLFDPFFNPNVDWWWHSTLYPRGFTWATSVGTWAQYDSLGEVDINAQRRIAPAPSSMAVWLVITPYRMALGTANEEPVSWEVRSSVIRLGNPSA